MQIRLFRGLGEPVWVNALSSACERLGPDPRRALGPAATPAASTGRTRDRTRPMLQNVRKFLPGRRPHVTQNGQRARHSVNDMISPIDVNRISGNKPCSVMGEERRRCTNVLNADQTARGRLALRLFE
jgi:hypothetical protein